MADVVRLRNKQGDEVQVSRKWRDRWPKDFSGYDEVTSESKTASAENKKTGGSTEKEAENGA